MPGDDDLGNTQEPTAPQDIPTTPQETPTAPQDTPAPQETPTTTQDTTATTSDADTTPPLSSMAPSSMSQQPINIPPIAPRARFSRSGVMKIGIIAIVVVIVLVGAFAAIKYLPSLIKSSTSTIAPVTSTTQVLSQITGCGSINRPGSYYLSSNINVTLSSGACINITASGVQLIGNGHKITGSGPFVGLPPFTYGIYINNAKNVTISGFDLSSFSYGIYLKDAENIALEHDNISKEAITGIFLNNSSNNQITNSTTTNNSVSGIEFYNSNNNKMFNLASRENAYFGVRMNNSINNVFQKSASSFNPTDLACFSQSGLSSSNNYIGSTCATSTQCSFAQCQKMNIPFNISSIRLENNIQSCGSIEGAGVYKLSSNLNMLNYVNTSNPLSAGQACINILSSSAILNCNGYTISNSMIGINAINKFNVTVENCKLVNNTYIGINLDSDFGPHLIGDTVKGSKYGIRINNVSVGSVQNVTTANDVYGIYLNSSIAVTVIEANSSDNTYGVYVNSSSSGLSFMNGTAGSNKKADLFCSADTYNSSANQVQHFGCVTTDCLWGATCSTTIPPPVPLLPINSCYTITSPGNYTLTKNIGGSQNCINIKSSNVNLDCNNHLIVGNLTGVGINASFVSGVTVNKCVLQKFLYGIYARNSKNLNFMNNSVTGTVGSIYLSNSTYLDIIFNRIKNNTGNASIFLKNITNSIIMNNTASLGTNTSSGFVIENSINNLIAFNNASRNIRYGFILKSGQNYFFNNTAYSNSNLDYNCTPATSGIYAENDGVNFGTSKGVCRWLVEINPSAQVQNCFVETTGQGISLSQDMLYTYGATCFSFYNEGGSSANNSVINCNNYTVLATNGGTFADIVNSSNVKVENCFIKNFTIGITSTGSNPIIQNDTIATANIGISVINTPYSVIDHNKVLNASYGLLFQNNNYATVTNNRVYETNISYEFSGGTASKITNNTANGGQIGMYLLNATLDTFMNNIFTSASKYGVSCLEQAISPNSLNK